ncbi:MAG: cobaltochelatase subunit CobN [Pseudomonadota bacterium]
MHLLAATPGAIDEGEPVDPGQSPADILVISAADTELAALAQARADMAEPPGLRLTSLAHLRHPMSIDLHLAACAAKCRLVIVRLLGGLGYWTYGAEQFAAILADAGIPLALLPGDDKPDAALSALSTVSAADYTALWSYLVEGGPENAGAFLRFAQAMLDPALEKPAAAKPLLRAGIYWPGVGQTDLAVVKRDWQADAPIVPVVFYRALVEGAGLHPINQLTRALQRLGLNPLPIFVASLKDPASAATIQAIFARARPDVILNCTAFAVGNPGQENTGNPLTAPPSRAPVFQVILSSSTEDAWEQGLNGLSARDIAMNVALPEVDGRLLSRAISFKSEAYFDEATQCPIATYRAREDRVEFTARLAASWAALARKPVAERRVALVLANYPNKDGRLANGVGLDTPASTVEIIDALANAGYAIDRAPNSSADLMAVLMDGPTNWLTDRVSRTGGESLSLTAYREAYAALPYDVRIGVEARWGTPEEDPFFESGASAFKLAIHRFGAVCVALQPARGYNIDPTETYHAPDLVPPHNYLATYFWLRARNDAVIHVGKHGNLEWLPGKAVALSETCFPEAVLGPIPHIYPFIVNDPGEGTQAKRRASAVIIDHLTPPLTRAESYGPMRDLEALVDEYFEAAGVDPRRIGHLRDQILSLTAATGLDADAGLQGDDPETDLAKLDAYLCDLKEAQIRDGLHVFGVPPRGAQERDLAIALARTPRGSDGGSDASLLRAMAADLGLGFDPLDCDMAAPADAKPALMADLTTDPWRSQGDSVERLELLAIALLDEPGAKASPGPATTSVLNTIKNTLRPRIAACGQAEIAGILQALDGKHVAPGPSGAPTRGRPDVLPTGRNFYSVDSRAVPTRTAWALGWKSASLLIDKYVQTHGDWPKAMLITAWGTANMRTGGDDIAQALALMGVRPQWDAASRRVTGFEIMPADALGRPRVDVTLRISGFFRDAFPQQVDLVDAAARAVIALDEPAEINPAAAKARQEENADGHFRVFGSKPGAYGAGLQALIDERIWNDQADLADAYLNWGGYAYGGQAQGKRARAAFEARLSQTEAIVQNQDNREHDLLDSDDYYQFEGGAAAAVAHLQGQSRPIYHNDHSRPERPVIRTLDDEIGRVVRSRVVNPKWIAGIKRHGYKGAFELAATVDYLFAFAATTGAVRDHHFDLVHAAFLEDDETRDFITLNNPPALVEIAERLAEAIDRGLWTPRSNSARALIDGIKGARVDA